MAKYRLLLGDCREMLRTLPDESVHCVVTSPPYWGLRDYGLPPTVWGGDPDCDHEWGPQEKGKRKDILPAEESTAGRLGTHERATGLNDGGRFCVRCGAWRGQLGLEPTPELYVEHMVEVFREVRRVLRRDGTLWLNLGDSYATQGGDGTQGKTGQRANRTFTATGTSRKGVPDSLKPKDLVGIPWRVALALQADGWWLRCDIVWAKPNPMPESVEDRPTKSHEYVFLLSRSERYFYDHYAIREPIESGPSDIQKMREGLDRIGGKHKTLDDPLAKASAHTKLGRKRAVGDPEAGRNARSVWTIATVPYPGAHFAVFPPQLAERCILAGTSARGCCPECGAPWERVVERPAEPEGLRNRDGGAKYDFHVRQVGSDQKLQDWLNANPPRTIGWRPTCDCEPREPVPCTVLDPFAGSGTTGMVATGHGRAAFLIELNPQYADLIRDRIGPMLEETAVEHHEAPERRLVGAGA